MNFLSNLSIRNKLLIGFGSILLILLVLSFSSYRSLESFNEAQKWNTHTYQVIGELKGLNESLVNMETGERGFLLAGQEKFLDPFNQGKIDFDQHFNIIKNLTSDNPQQQQNLANIKTLKDQWIEYIYSLIKFRQDVTSNTKQMSELVKIVQEAKGKGYMDQMRNIIAESEKIELKLLEERSQKAEQLLKNTIGLLLFGSLIAIILAVFISYFIIKQITGGISAVLGGIEKAANGDLTAKVDIHSRDEIGKLADGFNRMVVQQRDSMQRVLDSSEQVNQASTEISKGNQDLSQRTQEQASMLEEIAATIEEITASIQQTAANSGQADQVTQTTLNIVSKGESSVEETMEAMKEISVSSRQISEIIKVVNDIAFQTNLLALNAAVEAARAGEQGRGFAVVAAEVRNLAGRTAESSKEIEKLIKESVNRVERGNHLVEQSGEMLRQIVTNTKRTSDVVLEITSSIREQSKASNEIQISIQQLNQVTQQNAAMVEEIAATSESLNMESEKLNEMVSNFKIDETISNRKGYRGSLHQGKNLKLTQGNNVQFKGDDLERF